MGGWLGWRSGRRCGRRLCEKKFGKGMVRLGKFVKGLNL
jgi:hypothetical protein